MLVSAEDLPVALVPGDLELWRAGDNALESEGFVLEGHHALEGLDDLRGRGGWKSEDGCVSEGEVNRPVK